MARWALPGRRCALLFAAIFATALLGCGGGAATTPDAQPRAEHEFAKRLDVLCERHIERQLAASKEFREELVRSGGSSRAAPTPGELERQLLEVIVPNVTVTMHELDELRPPPGKKETLAALLRAMRQGIRASRADPSWIVHDRPEPFKPARKIADALGNSSCGEP